MEEVEKKVDRRIKKTKKAIRNAFAKLLSEKDLREISIIEIANTADINRKTFYNYYNGIQDIMDEVENEIISTIENLIKNLDFSKAIQNPSLIFDVFLNVINSDSEFYEHILKMNGNSSLITKIVIVIKKHVEEIFAETIFSGEIISLIIDYLISGIITVYQNWAVSDNSMSPKQISDFVGCLIFNGINGLIKSDFGNKN